jgi:AraC family transcriptional regulator
MITMNERAALPPRAQIQMNDARDWGPVSVQLYTRHTDEEALWHNEHHRLTLALTDPGPALIRGEGEATLTGRFGTSAVLLQPAGMDMRTQACPSRWVHVLMQPSLFRLSEMETHGGRPIEFALRPHFTDPVIVEMMRALARERGLGPADRLLVDGITRALAALIARQSVGGQPVKEQRAQGLSPRRLRRVRDYVEGHLHEELTLARLASVACLSPSHFSRSFSQAMGMGPHRYVTLRRIERAKRLLHPGGPPLATIAQMLGFGDQAHFANTFRKLAGTAPSRFRASLA